MQVMLTLFLVLSVLLGMLLIIYPLKRKKSLLNVLLVGLILTLAACSQEEVKQPNEQSEVILQEEQSTIVTSKEEVETMVNVISSKTAGNLAVHFVDVGQGAAQVIITPNKKVMVIDGGNNSEEITMVNYLTSLGITKVDVLVGTHPDADHIGGLDAVVDHFDIGKIYMPKVQRDTLTFESLLTAIANKGLTISTAKAGINIELDENVQMEMISPSIDSHSNVNEMSAVIKMTYGHHTFLLTGDAGMEMEEKWMAVGEDLAATVLLVGHHGSEFSTSEKFLQKVNPTYAVIQVGENSYGHPTDSTLNRLAYSGAKIYRNDTDGTIIFETDGSTMTVNKNAWDPSIVQTQAPIIQNQSTQIFATATINNSTPNQNESVSVSVKVMDEKNNPVSNANVLLNLAFKSKDTVYTAVTDSSGNATMTFKIGRPASGYQVNGNISVEVNGIHTNASIAFIPK